MDNIIFPDYLHSSPTKTLMSVVSYIPRLFLSFRQLSLIDYICCKRKYVCLRLLILISTCNPSNCRPSTAVEVYVYSVLLLLPILRVHLSSLNLPSWPAHRHFNSAILSIISLTLVLLRISKLNTLSLSVMPSIAHSITRSIRNLLTRYCVIATVSIPYVATGRTQALKSWSFRLIGITLSLDM